MNDGKRLKPVIILWAKEIYFQTFFKIQKIYLEKSAQNKDILNNFSQNIWIVRTYRKGKQQF